MAADFAPRTQPTRRLRFFFRKKREPSNRPTTRMPSTIDRNCNGDG